MKIAVVFSNGTEEIEGITMVDVARRAKIECDLVSIDDREIVCSRGVKVLADKLIGPGEPSYKEERNKHGGWKKCYEKCGIEPTALIQNEKSDHFDKYLSVPQKNKKS